MKVLLNTETLIIQSHINTYYFYHIFYIQIDVKGQWNLEWSSEGAEAYHRDWVYSTDVIADPA